MKSGEMRDHERISGMLQALRLVWERNPQLRLGQIIVAVIGENADPFYVEDDVAEQRLREWASHN